MTDKRARENCMGARTNKREGGAEKICAAVAGLIILIRHLGFLDARSRRSPGGKVETDRRLPFLTFYTWP